MTSRAVSPVLGLLLLLGLTTVVALGMLVVGATMLGGTQDSAQTQQVERSLSEFADNADQIAQGEASRSDYEVGGGETGSAIVDGDAGSYSVRIKREGGTETLTQGPLGVYRYTDDAGRTVAFQGGGVWRKDPGGDAQLVDPPQFHYRAHPDPTLTLPVVRIEDASGPAPEHGTMAITDQRDVYPVRPDHENPLHEGVVFVSVDSEYCPGWEHFFDARTDGSIAEACAETGDTVQGEVLVKLSVPLRIDGVHDGIWTSNADIQQNADVERVNDHDYHAESVDLLVDHRSEVCEVRGYETLSGDINDSGLHCTEKITDNVRVNTDEAGDVDIYTRDGMEKNNDITVTGDNGSVAVYIDEDVDYGGGSRYTTIGNVNDPTQTQLFFNSSADFTQTGDGNIYGLVYLPRSSFDLQAQGDGTFLGAIVAEDVHIGSASVRLEYEEGFEDVVIEEEGAGEPFYYLHVSETTMTVEG